MRSDNARRPWQRAPARALLLLCWPLLSAAADSPAPATPPAAENELPEYRTRSLPTDTFKPSEEVSEDFAVPFPADI